MESLKLIPYITLILLIAGVILGAAVLTTNKFGDSMTKCWNDSYVIDNSGLFCTNSSLHTTDNLTRIGKQGLNLSDEYYAVVKSVDGQLTIAEQQPTVAIIAVMVIIISIIAGVFVYMRFFA